MKRVLTALLALVMALSLCACGSSGSNSGADSSNSKIPMVDVVEMNYSDALAALSEAGFTNVTSNVGTDEDGSLWVVIKQSVNSGKAIRPEDLIELTCSKKCSLYLDIHSADNLFFNTYDIIIYLDGSEIGTVANGKHFTYLANVLSGEHTMRFCKSGSSSPNATRTVTVSDDMTFACDLSHDGSSISIKNETTENNIAGASLEVVDVSGKVLSEAKAILKEIGFSNIHEEPIMNIWNDDNWVVKSQSVAAGSIVDKNEYIQLDCVSFDDYFAEAYVGKNIIEIEELANASGFSLRFEDESSTNLNEKIAAMDQETKADWVAVKARQYGGADKTAVVTISFTGEVVEAPISETTIDESTVSSGDSSAYTDSEVIKAVSAEIDTAFASTDYLEYKVDIDDTILNVYFYPEGCTILAYQASVLKDSDAISSWNTIAEAGRSLSKTLTKDLHETMNRNDLTAALYYCDDTGSGNVFYCVMDGVVFYDYVNGVDLIGLG